MPVVNGTYVPYVTNTVNATSGFSGIIKGIIINIPWLFSFILVVFYLMMLVLFAARPGRKKYVYITFVGMMTAGLFEYFALVSPAIFGVSIAVWGFTVLFTVGSNE